MIPPPFPIHFWITIVHKIQSHTMTTQKRFISVQAYIAEGAFSLIVFLLPLSGDIGFLSGEASHGGASVSACPVARHRGAWEQTGVVYWCLSWLHTGVLSCVRNRCPSPIKQPVGHLVNNKPKIQNDMGSRFLPFPTSTFHCTCHLFLIFLL